MKKTKQRQDEYIDRQKRLKRKPKRYWVNDKEHVILTDRLKELRK